jgi:hypothetical protein
VEVDSIQAAVMIQPRCTSTCGKCNRVIRLYAALHKSQLPLFKFFAPSASVIQFFAPEEQYVYSSASPHTFPLHQERHVN